MKDFTIKQNHSEFTKALNEARVDLSNRNFSTSIKSSNKNVDLSKIKISSENVLEEYTINTNANDLRNNFDDSMPDEETLQRVTEIYDDYGATKDFYNKQKSDDEIIIGGASNTDNTYDTNIEDDDFYFSLDNDDEPQEDKSRYIDIDELGDLQNDLKSSIDLTTPSNEDILSLEDDFTFNETKKADDLFIDEEDFTDFPPNNDNDDFKLDDE